MAALRIGFWGHRAITVGLRRYEARHAPPGAPQVSATTTLLSWALRTVLWAVVLLAVLSNVGVNIAAFIASLGGEQVVMSNLDLLKQTISNYKRLQTRRIAFTFGVAPDTAPEQLAAVPAIVKALVTARPALDFQRAHFKSIGLGTLDFEVVYLVKDPGCDLYMDEQQALNLGLLRARGIAFASPPRLLGLA